MSQFLDCLDHFPSHFKNRHSTVALFRSEECYNVHYSLTNKQISSLNTAQRRGTNPVGSQFAQRPALGEIWEQSGSVS